MHPLLGHARRLTEGDGAPAAPRAEWSLRAHDRADTWRLSGLSSCGYVPSEVSAPRAHFEPHPNRHPIVDDVEPAARSTRIQSTQVPEHAPCFVYRIWPIPEETVR